MRHSSVHATRTGPSLDGSRTLPCGRLTLRGQAWANCPRVATPPTTCADASTRAGAGTRGAGSATPAVSVGRHTHSSAAHEIRHARNSAAAHLRPRRAATRHCRRPTAPPSPSKPRDLGLVSVTLIRITVSGHVASAYS